MSDSHCWSQRAIDSFLSPEDKKSFGHPAEGAPIPPIIQSYLENRDPAQWASMQNPICASEGVPACDDNAKLLASKALRLFETLHKDITGESVSLAEPETCEDIERILQKGMTYKAMHGGTSKDEPSKSQPPPTLAACPEDMVFSETGTCVGKPWHDYVSCQAEKAHGGCSDGNKWVQEHCAKTCAPLLRRGLKKEVPYPFKENYSVKSKPNFHLNDKTYNHGLVLTTAHGCTASEKAKLELWGHEGVRIVECINEDGQAITGTHPDSHYCNDVTAFPTFKTVENQLYPYPY